MKSDVFSMLNMLACSSGASNSMARLEAGALLLDDVRGTTTHNTDGASSISRSIIRETPEIMGQTHGNQLTSMASVIGVTSRRSNTNITSSINGTNLEHGSSLNSQGSRSRVGVCVRGHELPLQYQQPSTINININTNNNNNKNKNNSSISTTVNDKHVYEDVGIQVNGIGPPKITPVSGVLSKGKVVIRPIAFKPVSSSSSSTSPLTSGIVNDNRYSSMPSVNAPTVSPTASSVTTTSTTTTTNKVKDNWSYLTRTRNCLTGSVTSVNLLGSGSVLSVANNQNGTSSGPRSPSDYFSESELNLSKKNCRPSSQLYGIHRKHGGSTTSSSFLLDNLGSSTNLGSAGFFDSHSVTYSSTGTDSCLKLPLGGSETPSFSYLSSADELTPSPSDSGVAELEAMLKEKDSEINYLRETMEQNEQVIFKVYEEKEVGWQKELKRLKGHYDTKLKACQQRALKMEQVLMMQTYQLQQDKRKLRQECDELKREKEQNADEVHRELELMRVQLEETEWKMCQKTGEISLLKSQVKEFQNDQASRGVELLNLRAQLKEATKVKIETAETVSMSEAASSNRSQELRRELERLEADVEAAKSRLAVQRSTFEEERVRWFDEKEKVIRYQKQLQLNYVQMYRRNRTLESEVEQLTLELEHRDLKHINGESQC